MMKLSKIVGGMAVLVLALGGVASASTSGTYYPPERIHCVKSEGSRVRCEGFNHQYLTEDLYTSGFDKKEDTFNFVSGVAYFTPDMSEASVFFTYKNADQRIMKLKSTSVLLHPVKDSTAWTRVQDDLYVCDAGYMHCPITDA